MFDFACITVAGAALKAQRIQKMFLKDEHRRGSPFPERPSSIEHEMGMARIKDPTSSKAYSEDVLKTFCREDVENCKKLVA